MKATTLFRHCLFDSTRAHSRAEKIKINHLFVQRVVEVVPKRRVLYLDGSDGFTSRLLRKHGAGPRVVTNADPVAGKQLRRRRVCQVFLQKFGTFLSRSVLTKEEAPFGAVWADFCCTYTGNAECSPREDLRRVWQYGLDRSLSHGVVAWTFARRGEVKDVAIFKEQKETARIHGIHHLAHGTLLRQHVLLSDMKDLFMKALS